MNITVTYSLIIIILGLCLNLRNTRQRDFYILFTGLILILISGLRSIWVGTDDTSIYANYFIENSVKSYSEIWKEEGKDPFYYIFNKFIANIFGDDFQIFLIIVSIIFVGSTCHIIRRESKNPLVSFIVLLSFGFFFFSMNGIRQSLAISFILLSYIPLKERKLWRFIVLVIIASLFHKTALIFMIFYPIVNLKLNKYTIGLYILLTIACLLRGEQILSSITESASAVDERIANYKIGNGLTYSGFIQLLLIAILAFSYFKRTIAVNKNNQILYSLLIISIIFQSMAVIIAEMFRVAMYFSIFIILLLPEVFAAVPHNNRKLVSVGICSLFLFYFFFMGFGTIPYKFYFQ